MCPHVHSSTIYNSQDTGQPKCPTVEWIKKMWYNGILLSHEKEQNNAITAIWRDLEIIIQSEVNSEKDKYNIPIICGFFKK